MQSMQKVVGLPSIIFLLTSEQLQYEILTFNMLCLNVYFSRYQGTTCFFISSCKYCIMLFICSFAFKKRQMCKLYKSKQIKNKNYFQLFLICRELFFVSLYSSSYYNLLWFFTCQLYLLKLPMERIIPFFIDVIYSNYFI